jgi:hypothetical protein
VKGYKITVFTVLAISLLIAILKYSTRDSLICVCLHHEDPTESNRQAVGVDRPKMGCGASVHGEAPGIEEGA